MKGLADGAARLMGAMLDKGPGMARDVFMALCCLGVLVVGLAATAGVFIYLWWTK